MNLKNLTGTLKPHGPPMLAWMLSHYLVDPQISKHNNLGQRAFQLNVVEYLSQGLDHDPLNANQVISAISHGVVYSLLSILVTAFDPSRMNISNLVAKVRFYDNFIITWLLLPACFILNSQCNFGDFARKSTSFFKAKSQNHAMN